jgi:hypothetical protein
MYAISFNEDETGKTFTVKNNSKDQIAQAGEQPVENWPFYDPLLDNAPIFDGIKLIINDIDYGAKEISGSSSAYGTDYWLSYWDYYILPPEVNHDYEVEITSEMYDVFSIWRMIGYDEPNSESNFKVTDITTGEQINTVWMDGGEYNLVYDHGENIFLNHTPYGTDATDYSGYGFYFEIETEPAVGDVITIVTNKPLTQDDTYEFQTYKESYAAVTDNDLSNITTVPNPFVVSSRFEVEAYGLEKQIQFHFLPPRCTIRIYTIAGDLVQTIEHTDGTSIESWNLQSYNEQEVAFGVYFYHIDAGDIGEHIGKMAIIK